MHHHQMKIHLAGTNERACNLIERPITVLSTTSERPSVQNAQPPQCHNDIGSHSQANITLRRRDLCPQQPHGPLQIRAGVRFGDPLKVVLYLLRDPEEQTRGLDRVRPDEPTEREVLSV
jgi:hypothetical protein